MTRYILLALVLIAAAGELRAQMTYQTQEPAMTPKKREIFFYGMRSYPFGKIPQGARLEALDHMQYKMRAFAPRGVSAQSVNQWTQLGPLEVGGRIRSIVTHPTDGQTVWAAAADGGVWKSTNRGTSWAPIMDNENAIAMGAIAVDPTNTNVLYAGTGEMSSNVDAYTGAGIFKTIDGGATWRSIGLSSVGAFSRIVVPAGGNGSLIYVGATKNNRGLYRSTDNGNTWSRRLDIPVSDITVDPGNPSELWAGTMGDGIYHSTDRGETFTRSSTGIGESGSTLVRMSVQVAPSNPSILYALSYETDGTGNDELSYSRIYKTTDRGANWELVYNQLTGFLDNPGSPQGWYNNVIAVHPTDPNVVVAGGVHIARTTNGGANWTIINTYLDGGAPHPDEHALAFDPTAPDRVYIGSDGGVYKSEDRGRTYTKVSKGLAITQFYSIAVDPVSSERKAYGGTQDNGTVSLDSRHLRDGDGFYVAIDYSNPNILYTELENGEGIERRDMSTNQYKDIMAGIDESDTAGWSAPLVIDPVNPNVLWHGRHHFYKTVDRGDFWLETEQHVSGYVSAIGISPINTNAVYFGSDRGELMVTTDGGNEWTNRSNAPGFPNRAVTDIVPSRTSAGTAYMSTSGFFTSHVFKTTDYGATWSDIGRTLPDIPFNALAIHPDDENIIYAGSDIGMFITTDGGATWASYNQGLPRVVVSDLQIQRAAGKLVLASHGRSAWEISLEHPQLSAAIVAPAGGEVWMGGTSQNIAWSGFGSGPVRVEYSPNDGVDWFAIRSGVIGNSMRWRVIDTALDNARIRVTSIADPGTSAVSRSFSITRFERGGIITANAMPITPYGLAYDGSYLWVSDFSSNSLLKLDPNTLVRVGSVTMQLEDGDSNFTDMAYDPVRGHFFINKLNSSTIDDPYGMLYEVDSNGAQIGRWPSPCMYPTGVAYLAATDHSPERLIVTDRNGPQQIFFFNPSDPGIVDSAVRRVKRFQYGPRGATAAPGNEMFYQAITDFTGGGDLKNAYAAKIQYDGTESGSCSFTLTSPFTDDFLNVRGMELDPRDSNLWISDFEGNIYKIVSCDGSYQPEGPPASVGSPAIPAGFTLAQNQPNPFSGTTSIAFTLPTAAPVTLDLYDENGRMVEHIAAGRFEAGAHTVPFNPAGLASGVYHYRLTMNGVALTRAMIYVR